MTEANNGTPDDKGQWYNTVKEVTAERLAEDHEFLCWILPSETYLAMRALAVGDPWDPTYRALTDIFLADAHRKGQFASNIIDSAKRRAVLARHPLASRLIDMGAAAAIEPERCEEWREAFMCIGAEGTRAEVLRFSIGILYAGMRSRCSSLASRAFKAGISYLCWILRSQIRTWMPLLGLLLWGGAETMADTGPGAGIVFVILSGIGFFGLVEWLRTRWNVQVGRRSEKPRK